jgi:hypothetical protein
LIMKAGQCWIELPRSRTISRRPFGTRSGFTWGGFRLGTLLWLYFLANSLSAELDSDVGAVPRYLEPAHLTGTIYEKDVSPLRALFTFRRTAKQDGSATVVSREYAYPDGRPAARETVRYERNELVRVELDELQIDAKGKAFLQRVEGGSQKTLIQFEYQTGSGPKAKISSSVETQQGVVLVNDMIPGFLVANWDDLIQGRVVRFRYLVIPRLETIEFKLDKTETTQLQGRSVVRVRMRPVNRVSQMMIAPIVFTVESDAPHRILQYTGRTTPRIQRGARWQELECSHSVRLEGLDLIGLPPLSARSTLL